LSCLIRSEHLISRDDLFNAFIANLFVAWWLFGNDSRKKKNNRAKLLHVLHSDILDQLICDNEAVDNLEAISYR
ncbi:MAG: hypothetical protein J3Q66DRAFT_292569, partial [Benniella sp.]